MSDGDPTDKSQEEILQVISEENAKLNNSVIIQTYGIGQGQSKSRFLLCNRIKIFCPQKLQIKKYMCVLDELMKNIAAQTRANESAGEVVVRWITFLRFSEQRY